MKQNFIKVNIYKEKMKNKETMRKHIYDRLFPLYNELVNMSRDFKMS